MALAVVAGIAFGIRVTGRPAAGTIRPGGTAASQPIVPACAHLRVSWSGQAVSTMPGTIYALVFRDTAAGPCVLEGWPRVTVRAPASLTGLRVIDGSASGGFGPIRATRVVLGPGAEATADAQIGTPADGLGCVAPTWSVTPPGGGRGTIVSQAPAPLGQPEPAGPVSVYANGSVEVSPVYPGDQPTISPCPPHPAPSTSPLYSEAAGPEPPLITTTAASENSSGENGTYSRLNGVSSHQVLLPAASAAAPNSLAVNSRKIPVSSARSGK